LIWLTPRVNIELNHMALVYYKGESLTIYITENGKQSIRNLSETHRDQITKELARTNALTKRLGDTGWLRSPDQFRNEGDKFYAIKGGTVRFYGWFEPNGAFVISHAISKRHDKLESSDKKKMMRNQTEFRSNKEK
jgi:hypothetical protein